MKQIKEKIYDLYYDHRTWFFLGVIQAIILGIAIGIILHDNGFIKCKDSLLYYWEKL